jgi:4-hydroxy-3-polyprenylbenzoate decarboxylase
MRVSTITHRAGALINSFVHGAGGGELATLHQGLEFLLTPFVRAVVPALDALALPVVDGWQRCAVLALQNGEDSAVRAASAFWGLSWSDRVKLLILVDADVNVHHWPSVISAIGGNVDFGSDVVFHARPADPTDHGQMTEGSRSLAIDATFKRLRRNDCSPAHMPEEVGRGVAERLAEFKLPTPATRTAG